MLTAAELAARVGVHESTAVRLSQKPGYNGYRELRVALQVDTTGYVKLSERMSCRLENTPELATFVHNEVSVWQELLDTLRQEDIDAAAQMRIAAQRVFLNASTLLKLMGR